MYVFVTEFFDIISPNILVPLTSEIRRVKTSEAQLVACVKVTDSGRLPGSADASSPALVRNGISRNSTYITAIQVITLTRHQTAGGV